MFKRFGFLVASTALVLSASPLAAQQPVQWRYSFNSDGVATATYPGNVVINGETYDATAVQTADTIAALRANGSNEWDGVVFVKGYYAPGDLGAGFFTRIAGDTSADNGGTVIVDSIGQRWKRYLAEGSVTPQMFGAKCDGLFNYDDTPHIRAMFNAGGQNANLANIPPSSQCLILSEIVIDRPWTIQGPGITFAPTGIPKAQFVVNYASGNVFRVTTSSPVTFQGFGIRAALARTAGADIYIEGNGTAQSEGVQVKDIYFDRSFIPLHIQNARHWVVTGNYFSQYGGNRSGYAIFYPNNAYPDAGDNYITNNTFTSQNVGTTNRAIAALYAESALGLMVTGNKFFGGDYGIKIEMKDVSGNLQIANNSFEQQAVSNIEIGQSTAIGAPNNVTIVGNELSVLDSVFNSVVPTGPGIHIKQGATPGYATNIVISSNVFNNKYPANLSAIAVFGGDGVIVQGNTFNLYNEALPKSIQTGGNATNVKVLDNVFSGQTAAQYYGNGLSANTLLRDVMGLPVSALPNVANGSQVVTTDGTPGTACSGSGTGSMAFRQNGAWKCF